MNTSLSFLFALSLSTLTACGSRSALEELTEVGGALHTPTNTCESYAPPKSAITLPALLAEARADHPAEETGLYVIEDGGGALAARGWLTREATRSIDVHYFIFSADHLGLIALQELRAAASRGVKVRLLVDDLLYDGDAEILNAFNTLPNVEVRVYNPTINVGKSTLGQLSSVAYDFRGANQRMHNKTFIVDGEVVITGGRNVADEYFDMNLEYNFRDRDILLIQGVAHDTQASFNEFWGDKRAYPLHKLLPTQPKALTKKVLTQLERLTCDPVRFWPEVQQRIANAPLLFRAHIKAGRLGWSTEVRFVSDRPGKNDGKHGLKGQGESTKALIKLIEEAKESVVIQTPYLVTTELSQGLFARAIKRGVKVKILTNSLASTDNFPAFAGYQADRERLIELGVELYEAKPNSPVWSEVMTSELMRRLKEANALPDMGLHAKGMVVDGELFVVGTFNLDPRSAHLNTECVVIARHRELAQEMLKRIERELSPESAWRVTPSFNPDGEASFGRHWRAFWGRPVPKSIL